MEIVAFDFKYFSLETWNTWEIFRSTFHFSHVWLKVQLTLLHDLNKNQRLYSLEDDIIEQFATLCSFNTK